MVTNKTEQNMSSIISSTTDKTQFSKKRSVTFNVDHFLPSMHVFFMYHEILKQCHFIQDVSLVKRQENYLLRIERIRP
ncbi:MAG: hypothetical protein ACTSVU_04440 [Promethearchaeota archaeon]